MLRKGTEVKPLPNDSTSSATGSARSPIRGTKSREDVLHLTPVYNMSHVIAHSCVQRRRVLLVCSLLTLLAATAAYAQSTQTLRIVPLVRDDHVLVSFDLTNGFTEEVRAAIKSGLKTTYTYTVELRLAVPIWVDRTMGVATITSSVDYDNLKRLFALERRLDGRLVEEPIVTDDEADVREWMTSLEKLSLFSTSLLEPNREYYLRVTATARPSSGSILWPFGSGTSAQAKFTFLR